MDDIRISVILPVYGVEKYIGQCIETLKAQKLDGMEFLFIDDCSPDNSAAIVEAAASEDCRFRLIRQSRNGGPGVARNRGIEIARGRYLSFVDPDDWLDSDYYAKLFSAAEEHPEWDIIKGTAVYIDDCSGERLFRLEKVNTRMRKMLQMGYPLYLVPFYNHQSAIFKASVLDDKNIRYGNGKIGEDTSFLLRFCLKTQNIGFVDDAIYYYRWQRGGGLMVNYSEKRLQGEIESLREKISVICEYELDEYAYMYLRRRLNYSIINYCLHAGDDQALRAHESNYRKDLRDIIETIPGRETLFEGAVELRILYDFDVLIPAEKDPFYVERIRRWTDFLVFHPKDARGYANDYAGMMYQSIYSFVTDKRCDLRKNGYLKTVWPQWRRLGPVFKINVLWFLFLISLRMVWHGIWRRIRLCIGMTEKQEVQDVPLGGL